MLFPWYLGDSENFIEKIIISTPALECPSFELSGGYTVHPVPTPLSIVWLTKKTLLGPTRILINCYNFTFYEICYWA